MTISAKVVADSLSPAGVRLTTMELEYPRFIHAEMLTHRCLAGDTKLIFDLPAGSGDISSFRKFEMSLEEFYRKWVYGAKPRKASRYKRYALEKVDPDRVYSAKEIATLVGMSTPSNLRTKCRSGKLPVENPEKTNNEDYFIKGKHFIEEYKEPSLNSHSLRSRLEGMKIRMLNEETNEIEHTNITDIWQSGVKDTYKVVAGHFTIVATEDHPLLTSQGWKEVKDLTEEDSIIVCGFGVHEKKDPSTHKKIDGRWVSIFNKEVLSELETEQEGKCVECGLKKSLEVHHIKPVHQRPDLAFDKSNVVAVCNYCHHHIYHKEQGWQQGSKLIGKPVKVDKISFEKKQMTYDISVASVWHNFVANGIVVHNCFSRNSASSRAIPTQRLIDLVRENPAMPFHWGKNQPGMQAKEENNEKVSLAMFMEDKMRGLFERVNVASNREQAWLYAAQTMADVAEAFSEAGYHKQIVNRLLEPFQHMKVVVTATEWDNFFWLRRDKDAQPEIKELADRVWEAMEASSPQQLEYGEWHLPYVCTFKKKGLRTYHLDLPVIRGVQKIEKLTLEQAQKVSVSCCAQVSYRRNDTSLEKAEKIYDMLVTSRPVHASALEHCATPMKSLHGKYWPYDESKRRKVERDQPGVTHRDVSHMAWSGNLRGWVQYRQLIPENTCWQYSPREEE